MTDDDAIAVGFFRRALDGGRKRLEGGRVGAPGGSGPEHNGERNHD